jgi:hypothetical protein
MFALLLEKVGLNQGPILVKRLCSWVLSAPVPSVEGEVAVLVNEAATVSNHPESLSSRVQTCEFFASLV